MSALLDYINNPEIDINNFNLGIFYEKQKHYSPATSFYLRCAELTENIELKYESLLRLYLCYKNLGNRDYTCENILKQAICLCPNKAEAYFFITQHYESKADWMNMYIYASIGYEDKIEASNFISDINFPGKYVLVFQKAASAWWIGKTKLARQLFQYILYNYIDILDHSYKKLLEHNLSKLGSGPESQAIRSYHRNIKDKLKYKFNGIDTIENNYSQVYQDLFVLYMLDGKMNGTYLEIGAAEPFKNSNTALLETKFGWTGAGLELNNELVSQHEKQRQNPVLCVDALIVDYHKLLKKFFTTNIIDYLQLDIEPPQNTYEVLLSIPFDQYKFAIITYEHDYYVDITRSYRDKSRDYLESKGYQLVIPNVSPDNNSPFEDWWVHPDLIDKARIKDILKYSEPDINPIEKIFLNN